VRSARRHRRMEPQVNGVVRTLKSTRRELQAAGHEVNFLTPLEFRTSLRKSGWIYSAQCIELGCPNQGLIRDNHGAAGSGRDFLNLLSDLRDAMQ
jgi:hypothetical protein